MKLQGYTIRAERCTDEAYNPSYFGKYRHKSWLPKYWRYVSNQYGQKCRFIGASYARDFAQWDAERNETK